MPEDEKIKQDKEERDKLTHDKILTLKMLATITELADMIGILLENPSEGQKLLLKRKLAIIQKRLPRYASDIKAVVNRRDLTVLNLAKFLE